MSDALHLTHPTFGALSLGATAQDGQVKFIATAMGMNARCSADPDQIERFVRVLQAAVDTARKQRISVGMASAPLGEFRR